MAKSKLTQTLLFQAIDIAYEKAVSGLPGTDSAHELAQNYLSRTHDMRTNANALIRWQTVKAGSSGFITGLGGLFTLPLAIPANLVSVLYIQIRMIAAIAVMGGHDVRDDRVRALVLACLAGNAAKEILQEAGLKAGSVITSKMIGSLSEKTISAINQKLGIELLSKTGSKGLVNAGKLLPLAGGIVNGSFDVITTRLIGKAARNTFIG